MKHSAIPSGSPQPRSQPEYEEEESEEEEDEGEEIVKDKDESEEESHSRRTSFESDYVIDEVEEQRLKKIAMQRFLKEKEEQEKTEKAELRYLKKKLADSLEELPILISKIDQQPDLSNLSMKQEKKAIHKETKLEAIE